MNKLSDYKEFNRKLLIIVIIVLTVTGLFNFLIDPYNIFETKALKNINYYKPEAKRQERLTKFIALKLEKKVDTVFIGVSRTDWTLSPVYYEKITGNKAVNMAMHAAGFATYKDIIYRSLKIHPEIKNIVFAIDIENFMPISSDNPDMPEETISFKPTVTELNSALLSIDTTVSSIITIINNNNVDRTKCYLPDGMKYPFYNPNIKEAFENSIDAYKDAGKRFKINKMKELSDLVKELNSKGIKVILYTPPMHATYLEILDYNRAFDYVKSFKENLAEIAPFYDFLYINQYSAEDIKPDRKYFFEASHATYKLGNLVLDKIFLNKGNVGILINRKNVTKETNLQHNEFKKWQESNKELKTWIDSILKSKE